MKQHWMILLLVGRMAVPPQGRQGRDLPYWQMCRLLYAGFNVVNGRSLLGLEANEEVVDICLGPTKTL